MSLSPEAELVTKWGKAFQSGDLCLLEKLLDEKYEHVYYPKSIGMKTLGKKQFIAVLQQMFLNWAHSESTTYSMIDTPSQVVTHFSNVVTTKDGTVNPPYESILISTIVLDDDGTLKIGKNEEFVDSKLYSEIMQKAPPPAEAK